MLSPTFIVTSVIFPLIFSHRHKKKIIEMHCCLLLSMSLFGCRINRKFVLLMVSWNVSKHERHAFANWKKYCCSNRGECESLTCPTTSKSTVERFIGT